MWAALCDIAAAVKALTVCQKVSWIFFAPSKCEQARHQTRFHFTALPIFLYFHKIKSELKQIKVKQANRVSQQEVDQCRNKTGMLFSRCQVSTFQLEAAIH